MSDSPLQHRVFVEPDGREMHATRVRCAFHLNGADYPDGAWIVTGLDTPYAIALTDAQMSEYGIHVPA